MTKLVQCFETNEKYRMLHFRFKVCTSRPDHKRRRCLCMYLTPGSTYLVKRGIARDERVVIKNKSRKRIGPYRRDRVWVGSFVLSRKESKSTDKTKQVSHLKEEDLLTSVLTFSVSSSQQ